MGLLQKLLSTLGLRESSPGRGSERAGETTVTVEHEPDTASESAVKGTESATAGTTATGSTGTVEDSTEGETDRIESSKSSSPTLDVDETVEEDVEEAEPAADADGEEDESEAVEAETEDATATAPGSDESPDVLNGIGPAYAERLENAGVDTVGELAAADAADLADETGLGEGRIANWIEQAKEY